MRLNVKQIESLSQFFNTIAATWFTASVISPFFIKPEFTKIAIWSLVFGLVLAVALLALSLILLRKKK